MRTNEESITAHYRAALADGRLELPHCRCCDRLIGYPRARCPQCMSDDIDWRQLSGRGRIYSYTVNRRGIGPYAGAAPFVIAYVELDEGPRLLAQVRADPQGLDIGTGLQLVAVDHARPLTFAPTP